MLDTYTTKFALHDLVLWEVSKEIFYGGSKRIFLENTPQIFKRYLIKQGATPDTLTYLYGGDIRGQGEDM